MAVESERSFWLALQDKDANVWQLELQLIAPLLVLIVTVWLLFGMLVAGAPLFAPEVLAPKFEKINPAKAIKKLFGRRPMITFLMHVVRLTLLSVIFIAVLIGGWSALLRSPLCGFPCAIEGLQSATEPLIFATIILMLIMALADYLVQRSEFMPEQKMSITEYKREMKDREGDPHLKGKLQADQRETVESPTGAGLATVVVESPSGLAYGIRYSENDNRPPQTETRLGTGKRPTGVGPGIGMAAVAEALAEPGLANLNARDGRHLEQEYGIQLDPANPVDAEIAMEYTLNRGRSEVTRAIADNVARGYAPDTMPEAEAVEIVEERLEARAAGRTAAAIAAVSADNPTMEDDACAPGHLEGNWELASRPGMSEAALDSQRQIARTPDLGTSLVEYRVTDPTTGATALLDGCAHWSPDRELFEAKAGYGDLLEAAAEYGFPLNAEIGEIRQAELQSTVVGQAIRLNGISAILVA